MCLYLSLYLSHCAMSGMTVDCSSMLRFVNYCLMRRETVESRRKLFLLVQMPQPSAMPFGWDTGICVVCSCLFTLHISEEYKSDRKHWSDGLSNGRSWVNKLIVFRGVQKVGHTIKSTIIIICIPALHLLLWIYNIIYKYAFIYILQAVDWLATLFTYK